MANPFAPIPDMPPRTPRCRRARYPAAGLLVLATALAAISAGAADLTTVERSGGRELLLHLPQQLPQRGSRALVVVLHGGMGNAQRISGRQSESALNLDALADRYGFIVAYLNGTAATRMERLPALAWNAGGGCCGQAAARNVDDVAYISAAVNDLVLRYGVDRQRVFGTGHSNGAMMGLRMICETEVFAAVVSYSGTLNLPVERCPAARGRKILAIHGSADQNVPVQGGVGSKGISQVSYASQEHTRQVFEASGADYHPLLLDGADHKLEHVDAQLQRQQGASVAQETVGFFGLDR